MGQQMALDRAVRGVMVEVAVVLREGWTVEEALGRVRGSLGAGGGERGGSQVLYFYVVDDEGKLVGVLPARGLILAEGTARVGDVMTRGVVSVREEETLGEALELFAMHRLLAIPVVSAEGMLRGVVEVSVYTDEVFDLAKNQQLNEVFQLIGLRLEQEKHGSAWRGFRVRMPWLVANICGGLACAALGAFFEGTVQRTVIIALFIPLILTLSESVAVQSMTLAIEEAMHGKKGGGAMGREVMTAGMLGLCSGLVVGAVSLFWRGPWEATVVIGGALAVVMVAASVLGRMVPAVIHGMRLNPRIASGPVTLAAVDVMAITVYLAGATVAVG